MHRIRPAWAYPDILNNCYGQTVFWPRPAHNKITTKPISLSEKEK